MTSLSGLEIGALTLSPTFDSAVQAYTATTENDADKVTATPKDADHTTVAIVLGESTEVENGGNATWGEGENTLTITVSAAGNTPTVYTVTVTKS
ncbi:MAG: cadherin-like beta sandwich domain-containing protein [Bacteroidaceae bacterium]|nr:cadherin-like beta sandwich domain-containing protein [Bacteroidaceae bacterium]